MEPLKAIKTLSDEELASVKKLLSGLLSNVLKYPSDRLESFSIYQQKVNVSSIQNCPLDIKLLDICVSLYLRHDYMDLLEQAFQWSVLSENDFIFQQEGLLEAFAKKLFQNTRLLTDLETHKESLYLIGLLKNMTSQPFHQKKAVELGLVQTLGEWISLLQPVRSIHVVG